MIINLTRRTTKETHNPVRRMRVLKPWGQCKEITVKIPQGDNLRIWRH